MNEYHKNPRQISKKQFESLGNDLDELGDLGGVVHDLNSDEIIGGNQRSRVFDINQCQIEIVSRNEQPDEQGTIAHGFVVWRGHKYSYRQVRWTPEQCEKANVKANLAGGDWDWDNLENWNATDLQSWGFDKDVLRGWQTNATALNAMLQSEQNGGADAEAQVDRAAELLEKWKVETGDLWQIGEHRLICGDCTDAATVARVMGGGKIEMVWTDPPYGVAVGDKNKYLNSIAPSNRVEENLENDTLDESSLVDMLCASFDNAIEHCTAGAAWYVAAPAGPLHVLFGQVLKDRGIWRQTIQWVKNNSTFSPMGVCYHWQAEPIFFGWLPNGGHRFYGGRTQTTVWNIDRPTKSPEHPTMKPVELVQRAIENSSQNGEVVLDLFCGSGTMLLASENAKRLGRACEISPAYVAVALERMSQAFPGIDIHRIE